MMRVEEDARVSLDDTFTTDGTPSPDHSNKGSEKGKSSTKKKRKKKKRKTQDSSESSPAPIVELLRGLFGTLFPLFGGASWESVGISWVFPDLLHLFWRLICLGVLLGLYLSLMQNGKLLPFSSDVYSISMFASTLLLLPQTGLLIVGPHEDDLDSAGVRWLWSFVTMALQMATTHALVMVVLYMRMVQRAEMVHITPAGLLCGELLIGCAIPRLSYAIGGAVGMGVYLIAVRMDKTNGVGPWLAQMMQKAGWRMHLAIVGVYLVSGMCIVALGRARASLATWIERRRDVQEDGAGAEVEW